MCLIVVAGDWNLVLIVGVCVFSISLRGAPCGSKPLGLLHICQVILNVVETAETTESLTQPELLYSVFQNYAKRQSEDQSVA